MLKMVKLQVKKNNQTNHDNRISGVETKVQENKDSITQLENTIGGIINGDVGIGNADTLDGHDSTYFSKASHGHGLVEISDKPSSLPPSNHEHSWPSITGKPSSYPPSGQRSHNILLIIVHP